MNIYLSGLIGAGKSTLGERLAARMGRPFLDLDREMDAALGRSFHELVHDEGWLAFRELEYGIVKRFAAHLTATGAKPEALVEEAVWVLLNTSEFRFNH